MLTIYFKDGNVRQYHSDKYTDYEYLRDVFVVLMNDKWIGIYSMSEVSAIEVDDFDVDKAEI